MLLKFQKIAPPVLRRVWDSSVAAYSFTGSKRGEPKHFGSKCSGNVGQGLGGLASTVVRNVLVALEWVRTVRAGNGDSSRSSSHPQSALLLCLHKMWALIPPQIGPRFMEDHHLCLNICFCSDPTALCKTHPDVHLYGFPGSQLSISYYFVIILLPSSRIPEV